MTFTSIIIFLWVFFVAYWAISAIGVKKDIRQGRPWWVSFLVRLALIVVVTWIIEFLTLVGLLNGYGNLFVFSSPAVAMIGVVLCAAGIAFAIWARWHLGKNWSGSPQIKVGHELVTSGPYRFVRHPIYTGMILALFGSALVGGIGWFIVFVFFSILFIARIKKEESFMMKLFPDQYPAYKKRTKALIPFVI